MENNGMIILTDTARKELEGFFQGKDKEPIRVYLTAGCGGAQLQLVLDGPTDADSAYEVEGFPFCIDKELEEAVGDVNVDVTYMGFVLTTEKPLPEVPSSCGGCCSSCGSHAEEAEGGEAGSEA